MRIRSILGTGSACTQAEQVRQLAVESLGTPKRTWAVGNSLGAHAALASIERHPRAYDGALALCGINAPAAEVFADGVLPVLLAFDAYFPGVLGLAPGGLADPASPPDRPSAAIEAALQTDAAKAALIADGFDIRRDDLAGALMLRYLALSELRLHAGQRVDLPQPRKRSRPQVTGTGRSDISPRSTCARTRPGSPAGAHR